MSEDTIDKITEEIRKMAEDVVKRASLARLPTVLWLLIADLVGFRASNSSFASITSVFRKSFDESVLKRARIIDNCGFTGGHCIDECGIPFNELLDFGRWTTYAAHLGWEAFKSRPRLDYEAFMLLIRKQRPACLGDLIVLNAAMYTYWHRLGSSLKGVCDHLRGLAKNNPEFGLLRHIDADAQYWHSSRKTGKFYFLLARRDGAVVIDEAQQNVYLVQGIAQPLAAQFCLESPQVVGREMQCTLLNWSGAIAYDGLMVVADNGVCQHTMRRLVRIYCRAVDGGTVITQLEKIAPDAPPPEISPAELADMKEALQPVLDALAAAAYAPSETPSAPSVWTMRRHGYSDEENPLHLVTVMSPLGGVIFTAAYSALVPSPQEVVMLLAQACAGAGNVKPSFVNVDTLAVFSAVKSLLRDTGISANYYPPPSDEELRAISRQQSGHIGASGPLPRPRGKVCAQCLCADDPREPLLRCAKCKQVYYCCAGHQRQHWAAHKLVCSKPET